MFDLMTHSTHLRLNGSKSGQIRSECLTCNLEQAVVAHICHGTGKEGEGMRGGTACTGGYKRVQAGGPGSVSGGKGPLK